MGREEWDARVRADIEARRQLREAKHPCPVCQETGLMPLGGAGSCWFECPCGAYSALGKTWEEALANVAGWRNVDPELNNQMNPPVGGSPRRLFRSKENA